MDTLIKTLLQTSLRLDFNEGFTFTSGIKSPIYCNNRLLIGNPQVRNIVITEFLEVLKDSVTENTVIAGIATAGIPWASIIADRLGVPCAYIRPERKGHGTQDLVEGACVTDKKVILIEDTITTGGSSVKALNNLLAQGADITACLCIFSYRFHSVDIAFQPLGLMPIPLVTFHDLVSYIKHTDDTVGPDDVKSLLEWYDNKNIE
jgi:orotate phosphoribosyltransferase